ncbi:metallophosphoesterase family protein [Gloeothece verrucosa]|uniref:Metallophosphoesterase n=1 Tax=Gloeothece verrucosa (strain PCC 7822) TaxID=497965 RepID=E0UK72_GLOV7|nr:metallophosphoesterase [Gloeothece verrucosa]ADN15834.1 metallophosphoesterase [Gloeothece verrucosa PCC 7822]
MKFIYDPPSEVKINKMKQRVRWQESCIKARSIDQTQLVIEDQGAHQPEFSFLVIGDSGCGEHLGHNPQRQITEMMLSHYDQIQFLLHTGDVIYQVGSSEYYYKNFICPYREFLVGGEGDKIKAYTEMVFNKPFLTVPGNHDYYDLPIIYGFLFQVIWPLRHLLKNKIDLDVGWHGSHQGEAYAEAFLDYLLKYNNNKQLETHLDSHYTAQMGNARCLRYQPGQFTRLPNRYYTFRYGGIDFFALDSNTFNEPEPIPQTREGEALRRQLMLQLNELEFSKQDILEKSSELDPNHPEQAEQLDDYRGKLNQIEETQQDIEKRLKYKKVVVDFEQLNWLKNQLIESWHTEEVRGRILFFHHPPYVTEATKYNHGETLAIRRRLREVFDQIDKEVKQLRGNRPLVDLVLCGHAHCLEYLYTENTGHADSNINWIICGGSGHSLRRQKKDGPILSESTLDDQIRPTQPREIGRSKLFVGRNGRSRSKRRPYSFLRIDVKEGTPPQLIIRPFVAERYQHQWNNYSLEPFTL